MHLGPDTGAIVSGGASGLGEATARMLRIAGAPVTLLDRDGDRGRTIAEQIGAVFLETDVTDPASVADALSALTHPFRLCVCCAGIAPGCLTVSRDGVAHDHATFARTIAINLTGSFTVATQAAAVMTAQAPFDHDAQRGAIILTASIAAFEGQIGQVAYGASKGGITGMVLPMARDLARHGIRVNAIAPGLFKTPMVAGLPDDVQAALGAAAPYPPRLGDPAEFAQMVRSIAENPMLNGTTIRLDGAIRLPPN